jgi:FkbM family methyltransferase
MVPPSRLLFAPNVCFAAEGPGSLLPSGAEVPRRFVEKSGVPVHTQRRYRPMGLVKNALRRTFRSLPFPILRGPLRGSRWLLGSGGKLGRVLLSTYEPVSTGHFLDLVEPGATVYDIGAHMGYYTLLAANATGPDGAVVAFEPQPRNALFLRRHAQINGHRQVTVEQLALTNTSGTARFQPEGSGTGHFAEDGEITVRMTTLDGYAAASGLPPDVMKIDVEGAEAMILEGARTTLASARPSILLSTHGPEVERECRELLEAAGYTIDTVVAHEGDDGEGSGLLCLPTGDGSNG